MLLDVQDLDCLIQGTNQRVQHKHDRYEQPCEIDEVSNLALPWNIGDGSNYSFPLTQHALTGEQMGRRIFAKSIRSMLANDTHSTPLACFHVTVA